MDVYTESVDAWYLFLDLLVFLILIDGVASSLLLSWLVLARRLSPVNLAPVFVSLTLFYKTQAHFNF